MKNVAAVILLLLSPLFADTRPDVLIGHVTGQLCAALGNAVPSCRQEVWVAVRPGTQATKYTVSITYKNNAGEILTDVRLPSGPMAVFYIDDITLISVTVTDLSTGQSTAISLESTP